MNEIEIVKEFYMHLANGDRRSAYKLLTPDFLLKQASSLPYGGEFVGVDGLNIFFEKFFAFWKEFKTLQTDYYFCDKKVFATSKVRAIVRDSDKIIETEMIQVYELVSEKLSSAQPFYFDTKLFVE